MRFGRAKSSSVSGHQRTRAAVPDRHFVERCELIAEIRAYRRGNAEHAFAHAFPGGVDDAVPGTAMAKKSMLASKGRCGKSGVCGLPATKTPANSRQIGHPAVDVEVEIVQAQDWQGKRKCGSTVTPSPGPWLVRIRSRPRVRRRATR
jgi:hypothetical protein